MIRKKYTNYYPKVRYDNRGYPQVYLNGKLQSLQHLYFVQSTQKPKTPQAAKQVDPSLDPETNEQHSDEEPFIEKVLEYRGIPYDKIYFDHSTNQLMRKLKSGKLKHLPWKTARFKLTREANKTKDYEYEFATVTDNCGYSHKIFKSMFLHRFLPDKKELASEDPKS
jgi:hypothetical protein